MRIIVLTVLLILVFSELNHVIAQTDNCSPEYLANLEKTGDHVASNRRELICELLAWENWYGNLTIFYDFMWNGFTITIIIITALTSFLSGA